MKVIFIMSVKTLFSVMYLWLWAVKPLLFVIYIFFLFFSRGGNHWVVGLKWVQYGSEVHELTKRLKQTKLSWVWCVKMYRIWTKRIRQPCCIITNSSCLFFKSLWLYKQSSWKNKRLRMYINVWNPKQILSRRCRQKEIVKNKR